MEDQMKEAYVTYLKDHPEELLAEMRQGEFKDFCGQRFEDSPFYEAVGALVEYTESLRSRIERGEIIELPCALGVDVLVRTTLCAFTVAECTKEQPDCPDQLEVWRSKKFDWEDVDRFGTDVILPCDAVPEPTSLEEIKKMIEAKGHTSEGGTVDSKGPNSVGRLAREQY
jgi:hypothetical protein